MPTWNNGWHDSWNDNRRDRYCQYRYDDSYAARNGFVCQPGTGAKTAVAIFAGKAAQKRKQKRRLQDRLFCARV